MVRSADILIEDVKALRRVVAAKAREYQFTPMIGRSHGIHAEPTTFGLKMALMYDEFGRGLERIETAREAVAVGKLSGAVGTNAGPGGGEHRTLGHRIQAPPTNGGAGSGRVFRQRPKRFERHATQAESDYRRASYRIGSSIAGECGGGSGKCRVVA